MRLRTFLGLGLLATAAGFTTQMMAARAPVGIDAARRGRAAATPAQMTPLGWRDIIRRTIAETSDDRLFMVAAGVAFYALLALVPALTALISVYGLIANPSEIWSQIAPFVNMMPQAASDLVREQVTRLGSQPASTLSIKLVIGVAIALWGANAAIKALFDALNVIYDEDEKRSFIRLTLLSLATTLGAVVLVSALLFAITLLPVIVAALPFSTFTENLINALRWPVFFVLGVVAIAVLYWIGPSRRPARFVWLLPGAALAALLWMLVSMGFSAYVSTMGDYEASYGSLAAIVVFMTWLWLSASIILIGAELNAELEHQTARDTTIGMPKPLGLRGAEMADSIGPAVAG